jgi:TPR repeat protein
LEIFLSRHLFGSLQKVVDAVFRSMEFPGLSPGSVLKEMESKCGAPIYTFIRFLWTGINRAYPIGFEGWTTVRDVGEAEAAKLRSAVGKFVVLGALSTFTEDERAAPGMVSLESKRAPKGGVLLLPPWRIAKVGLVGGRIVLHEFGINDEEEVPARPGVMARLFDSFARHAARESPLSATRAPAAIERLCDIAAAAGARCFKRWAEEGDAEALFHYGECLRDGAGVERNVEQAMVLFRTAADRGVATAQCEFGWALLDGKGVVKDEVEAARYWKLGSEQGDIGSHVAYCRCLIEGVGVPKDVEAGVRGLQGAADGGDAEAQARLGMRLALGHGVRKDEEAAFRYFVLAAEQGHAKGQVGQRRPCSTDGAWRRTRRRQWSSCSARQRRETRKRVSVWPCV